MRSAETQAYLDKIKNEVSKIKKRDDYQGIYILFRNSIRLLVENGELILHNKTIHAINEELREKAIILDELPYDYKNDLLREAREQIRKNNVKIGVMIYSTWIEHWVNRLITFKLITLDYTSDEISNVIRILQINSKITWLFKMLSLPPLDEIVITKIKQVCEERNGFVHYKYKRKDENCSIDIIEIEKMIYTMRRYERDIIYGKDFRLPDFSAERVAIILSSNFA